MAGLAVAAEARSTLAAAPLGRPLLAVAAAITTPTIRTARSHPLAGLRVALLRPTLARERHCMEISVSVARAVLVVARHI